ncbi:MAG: 30S ribosomal protein S16 [Candidatus Doudnabacteria bacterium]
MLRIRLTRRGKRNRPFFRIVVAEARAPIKGRFIEVLGGLDPLGKKTSLKEERIKYWLSCGAKPSDTVHNLLVGHKIIAGPKIKKFAHRKKKGEEASKEEAKKEEVNPIKEQDSPTVHVDGGVKPPSALSDNDHQAAFSNGVKAETVEETQQKTRKSEKPAEAEKEKQEDTATQKETADKEEKAEPAQKAPEEEPKPEKAESATTSKVEPLPTIETKP